MMSQILNLTVPRSIGKVARTMTVKKSVIILGGLFGSGRKTWCISGNLPYLSGESGVPDGEPASVLTSRLNASSLYAFDDPKEPMTIFALIGLVDLRNCEGRSL